MMVLGGEGDRISPTINRDQAEMSTREPDAIPNHVTKQLGKVYVLAVVCGVTWETPRAMRSSRSQLW